MLRLPGVTITLAENVNAGTFTPPVRANGDALRALPAFCRVAATLKPANDSDIKIETWLPASGWNGKFQAVGNGAFNGSISYPALMTAIGLTEIYRLSPTLARDQSVWIVVGLAGFLALIQRGLEFFDLEYDVAAFNERLPRIRVIPIDEFDPADFL